VNEILRPPVEEGFHDFELYCPYIDWRFSLYIDRDDILEQLAQVVHQE